MDPLDNEWYTVMKGMINEESLTKDNVGKSLQLRELGLNPPNNNPLKITNKAVLENVAEDILVQKPLNIKSCDLPGYPRSTFLMVFSPDGTKVASSHGNHNVYVSELASGKHVRILKGHPRTPWCIAFHPSHPELIGSGCLGGQVRVWDISSGGSEVWNVQNETVIASIAFHPREQLLVIATFNEIYFWDWSQPAPFTKVSTNNTNEKVRYVAFDALGYKLITGISLWTSPARTNSSSLLQQNTTINPNNNQSSPRRDDSNDNSGNNTTQENPGSAQDIIVNSYQNLVQRYDSLVRNYQRLFMVRHRLSNTPQPPNTTDRGTDPMELDSSPPLPSWIRNARPITSTGFIEGSPSPSTSRRQDGSDSGDGEGSSSRLLNLDVLSFDNPPRNQDSSNQEHSIFGSRSSAFQPLNDSARRSFRTIDQDERATRLLPNPFSSSNPLSRSTRITFTHSLQQSSDNSANTSRTSIFTPSRSETTLDRDFTFRRRNSSDAQQTSSFSQNIPPSTNNNNTSATLRHISSFQTPESAQPSTSGSQRPRMTNSSTQMSPTSASVDAQAINESLDLIRDILRDSGTRLLNLITNMSLSTLANVERNAPRRPGSSRTLSGNSGTSSGTQDRTQRPRVRFFNSSLFRDFLSSSSDSDSDPEINIFRTRNSSFRDNDSVESNRSADTAPDLTAQATDRMVFELSEDGPNGNTSESGSINVSLSNSRFRVRTQSNSESSNLPNREEGTTETRAQSSPDLNRPSTSRDDFWARGNNIPPEEAYRKVKAGVIALQKHTVLLTDLWLRGNRTTMRELRTMWENLRRRILSLHRETGRQDFPSYYTRSLLERCMMLTDISDDVSRNLSRSARSGERSEGTRNRTEGQNVESNGSTMNDGVPSTSSAGASESRQPRSGRPVGQRRSTTNMRTSPSFRRRHQSSYRWRPEDELRRRFRNPIGNRLSQRYSNRFRRDFSRSVEISATRHEIRMRAMQVLSAMFNMMMMCLEERGLSQLIITMLRTLKKALALTCLMLMTNRNNRRAANIPAAQRMESLNVIHIQNADDSGPINVDEPEEVVLDVTLQPANDNRNESKENLQENISKENKSIDKENPSGSQMSTKKEKEQNNESSPISAAQKWSNRLAVQIAAANRNNSATARFRRDLYLESRKLKALHRTNPTAHPLIKKRSFPPVSTYKIPSLRSLPHRTKLTRNVTPRQEVLNNEPVAGPSNINAPDQNANEDPLRLEALNEFEHRVNLIRLAHIQAVRLRNAARNRFRRLQTIRLYTPSSVRVRETFTLPPNLDQHQGNQSQQNEPEPGPRRFFATYRSHIPLPFLPPMEPSEPSDEPRPFQPSLNNVGMPVMQVNDLPVNSDPQNNQAQRLFRIQEYLQPIILAQNAMVVDEDGNGEAGGGDAGNAGNIGGGAHIGGPMGRMGGMAGLLDAGIISEVLPAPSHRVQAWDFTKGQTPDIADSTKNVVVRKCRIHNDASIDISKDGRILVAILPVPQLRNTNHWLGVYSLEWSRLGQCLHTAVLEQSAVSVALSPTGRHLAVGLGARRFTHHHRSNVFALLYRLDSLESTGRSGLTPVKELEQNWEQGFTSLNCLRWAPQPGQGLVYANNTGQLIIMS